LELKEKATYFEQTAINIQKELENVYAYLEDFKLKNEATLRRVS
jgi:hypothetical protein